MLRALIIEDDSTWRRSLKSRLRFTSRFDENIPALDNFDEALCEILTKSKSCGDARYYDLIILDPSETPESGLEPCLNFLRTIQEINADSKIVVVTGNPELNKIKSSLDQFHIAMFFHKNDMDCEAPFEERILTLFGHDQKMHDTAENFENKIKCNEDWRLGPLIENVGIDTLSNLVHRCLPHHYDYTLNYIGEGYSGAYVFSVQANTIIGDKEYTFVLKTQRNYQMALNECKNCERLRREGLSHAAFPNIYTSMPVSHMGWHTIAFQYMSHKCSLRDFYNHEDVSILTLQKIVASIFDYLENHIYGKSKRVRKKIWSEVYGFYGLIPYNLLFSLEHYGVFLESILDEKKNAVDALREFLITDSNSGNRIGVKYTDTFEIQHHGDLHSMNILVDDRNFVKIIDYASLIPNGHFLADYAKLQTDIIMVLMDSNRNRDWDIQQITKWWEAVKKLLINVHLGQFGQKKKDFSADKEINRGIKFAEIVYHRAAKQDGFNTSEYIFALLHFTLRAICYETVTIPKKILGFQIAAFLLNRVK